MPDEVLDIIKLYLPKYLTPEQTAELFSELDSFPSIPSFYLPPSHDPAILLQGDAWRGLILINFHSAERRPVTGVVLSNSCDIDPANPRRMPPNVIFAPLLSVARYIDRLREHGQSQAQIDGHVDAIRKQGVSNIFHFPTGQFGPEESMILFDDLHAHPVDHFLGGNRERVFRLGQTAFYMFLLKLAIHFCRFQEGVPRFGVAL